jgi:hypothetical protein
VALTALYVIGPVVAFAAIAGLAVILRWKLKDVAPADWFDPPYHGTRPAAGDSADTIAEGWWFVDYGLLRPVATVGDEPAARMLRRVLAHAGIRSTVAYGAHGQIRVLVFDDELDSARRLVEP